MKDSLPGAAGALATDHPEIWEAYSQLGEACAQSGPLSDREKRLVKLALARSRMARKARFTRTRGARSAKV